MGRASRAAQKAPPVSVALAKPERTVFASEAKRRGLGLSTTIRTLAFERINELREQRQRERAMGWQMERLRDLVERIHTDGFREASQSEIDAIFAEAEELDRSASATSA